jgi:hypothetical protein
MHHAMSAWRALQTSFGLFIERASCNETSWQQATWTCAGGQPAHAPEVPSSRGRHLRPSALEATDGHPQHALQHHRCAEPLLRRRQHVPRARRQRGCLLGVRRCAPRIGRSGQGEDMEACRPGVQRGAARSAVQHVKSGNEPFRC